jgi:DNA-binding MarR family transcriptional regulator
VAAKHDELQRRLLLELVTHPPADGDRLDELAHRLDAPRDRVVAAIDALSVAGLAHRDATTARASNAALRFEQLWPAV